MDKKAAYLISIGLTIIFVLFFTLTSHYNVEKISVLSKIVKQELKSPEDVKGVFKNIYVAYKEEAHEEEFIEEEAEEEHEISHEEGTVEKEPEPIQEGLIRMENPAYSKHKKPIVIFTHLAHIEEYKLKCGACHHDDKGKPLNNISMKDHVDSCIKCHSKPGQKPKGKDAPKLSRAQELAFHAEAIHLNCIDCHKKFNKDIGEKKSPVSCAKCHLKKK